MNEEELQAWRRTRLEALANRTGGKAQLGRKLGYADGAFIGQMISGVRPITEKTIRAAEALRDESTGKSFRGWFSFLPPEQMPSAVERYANVLRDLEDIPPGQRHRLLDEISETAELAREAAAYHAARAPSNEAPLTDEELRQARALELDPEQQSPYAGVRTPPKGFPRRSKG